MKAQKLEILHSLFGEVLIQGQALMQRIRAKYVYGLTATPNRSDRLDDIIYMLLWPVRHRYTAKDQADEQGLLRFVIPRFTRVVNISGKKLDIHGVDSLIADSSIRNEQLIVDTAQAVAEGRTPVILTKLKRHAEMLSAQLEVGLQSIIGSRLSKTGSKHNL